MIRVTYADNSIEEYDLSLNEVLRITKYSKIEKQVKDLTLEECYTLDIYREPNGILYKVVRVAEDGFEQMPLHFDDYIDITDLIKEVN